MIYLVAFYLAFQSRVKDTKKPCLSSSILVLCLDVTTPRDSPPGITESWRLPHWRRRSICRWIGTTEYYINECCTTSRNGSDFKPNTQELLSSSHAILAPKPSKMPNHLLSNASTTKSLPARLALAPFGLWPKLSPKTFANHLSLHYKTTLTLLLPLLHPRLIFLRQSLPPTPTWTTKGCNLITSPFKIHSVTH